jgi:hypothetical protein
VCSSPFDLIDAAREYCTAFSESQQPGSCDREDYWKWYLDSSWDPAFYEKNRAAVIEFMNSENRRPTA